MIVVTTPTIEGHTIVEYRGLYFGEVIAGINFLKDIAGGLRNFFGGRSQAYEEELINARGQALNELVSRAQAAGCNGLVGVDLDYEVLGNEGNNMLLVTVSGTGVVIQ